MLPDILASVTPGSHFTVTPSPATAGVFEVEEVALVSPTPRIRIIQPIHILTTATPTTATTTATAASPFADFFRSTARPNISPVANQIKRKSKQKQQKKIQKQHKKIQKSPALTFVAEDNSVTSVPRGRGFARQQVSEAGAGAASLDIASLPEQTPLGVRLQLEAMLSSAGQDVEMRPIPGDPGVDYPVLAEVKTNC